LDFDLKSIIFIIVNRCLSYL